MLRIAVCQPKFESFLEAMLGKSGDASIIQQCYIVSGLRNRGHSLTLLGLDKMQRVSYSHNGLPSVVAPRSWSKSFCFENTKRAAWCMQRLLGIPYLNVFSNYAHYDATLGCLRGQDIAFERIALYSNFVTMACKRLKLPYVLFFDADQILELDVAGEPLEGLLRLRAEKLLNYNLKSADRIICVSQNAKNHLVQNRGVPSEKIIVLRNGVDINRFQPYPEERSIVRKALGIDGQPLLIFVGNFYEWHDVQTLLDAFAQVIQIKGDVHLLLVGDGKKKNAMMKYAVSLNIEHAVRFAGLVPHLEVPKLVGAADIAVAPYKSKERELWLSPMKIFEYMASGTAIVASQVGQIDEIIQDNHNGLLFPQTDVASLTGALLRLLEDGGLRARLGQQARKDAMEKYSWDNYVQNLEQLLLDIISFRKTTTNKTSLADI